MAKFMFKATYTKEGIAGVLREGGSGRAKAIHALAESAGGRIESTYWALGDTDIYLIADMPDAVSAASVAATVGATGMASVTTVQLLTADDVDQLVAKSQNVDYRPPGG